MHPWDIVGIGGANIDICARCEKTAFAGDSNPGTIRLSAGGVCRNICENAVRMGCSASLISLVGDDSNGAYLLRRCRDVGLDVSQVEQIPNAATGAYCSVHSSDGEMVTAVNDMRIISRITPEYLSAKVQHIRSAKAILLDGNLPENTLCWLADTFSDMPLFADPVSCAKAEKLIPVLPRLFLIKPNLMEARILTGEDTPESCARKLQERGVRHVCVSCGQDGVYYCGQHGSGWTRPIPLQHFSNATGAGDSMMAGLLACFVRWKTIWEALAFSVTASVLTLQSPETICSDLTYDIVLQKQKECLLV